LHAVITRVAVTIALVGVGLAVLWWPLTAGPGPAGDCGNAISKGSAYGTLDHDPHGMGGLQFVAASQFAAIEKCADVQTRNSAAGTALVVVPPLVLGVIEIGRRRNTTVRPH
jgi:hypothetical protein